MQVNCIQKLLEGKWRNLPGSTFSLAFPPYKMNKVKEIDGTINEELIVLQSISLSK